MTSRFNESSNSNCYTPLDARANFASINAQLEEGCPMTNECGTICGETRTLTIFQEFRQIYEDCLRKMECIKDDSSILKKLGLFKKFVEYLWEQNTMLVKTVEELEQEATNRVEMLQNKLDQCCEKVDEYIKDIQSLVEIIRRFREKGVLDSSGLKFNTICDLEIYGCCADSCNAAEEGEGKGKFFNENSRDSKHSKRKISLRDSSTSTVDICVVTNATTNTFKNISCQNDYILPITQCNESYSKLSGKNKSKNVKNTNMYESVCSEADARDIHYSIGKNYRSDLGMKTSDKIKIKSCKAFGKNSLTLFNDFRNTMGPEECHKNFSTFRSALNCTEEKNLASKPTENDSKFTLDNFKCKGRTIKTAPKKMPSDLSDCCSKNFIIAESKHRDTHFGLGKSVNINLNVTHESRCLECGFSKCDCNCSICGSYK